MGEYRVDNRLPDWALGWERLQAASQAAGLLRNVLTQFERKTFELASSTATGLLVWDSSNRSTQSQQLLMHSRAQIDAR